MDITISCFGKLLDKIELNSIRPSFLAALVLEVKCAIQMVKKKKTYEKGEKNKGSRLCIYFLRRIETANPIMH